MKRTEKIMGMLLIVAVMVGCTSEQSKATDRMIAECTSSIEQKDISKAKKLLDSLGAAEIKLSKKQQSQYINLKEQTEQLEEKIRQEQIEAERKAEEERRNSFEYKGWNYILNRLKSPSTAKLAGYVSPNEEPTRRLTDDLGMSGVKLAVFMVDAQNGFGAMIRTVYYVFFDNGTPFAIMEESEVASANMTQLNEYLNYARSYR